MFGFVFRTAIAAVALWVAVSIVPGLQAQDGATLVLAAILLGIVNATLRPVALFLAIPLTIFTLGLFILVVNAGMLAFVAWLVPAFTVADFKAALLGAIVVSIVSTAINGGLTTR
jgi:putative membrane protein